MLNVYSERVYLLKIKLKSNMALQENVQLNDFYRQPTPDEWGFFGFVSTMRLLDKTVETAICDYKDAHNVKETEGGLRTKYYKLAAFRRQQNKK